MDRFLKKVKLILAAILVIILVAMIDQLPDNSKVTRKVHSEAEDTEAVLALYSMYVPQ